MERGILRYQALERAPSPPELVSVERWILHYHRATILKYREAVKHHSPGLSTMADYPGEASWFWLTMFATIAALRGSNGGFLSSRC